MKGDSLSGVAHVEPMIPFKEKDLSLMVASLRRIANNLDELDSGEIAVYEAIGAITGFAEFIAVQIADYRSCDDGD